jgi:hypothetical protein
MWLPLKVVGMAPLSVPFYIPGRLGRAARAGAGTVPPGRPPVGGPPPPPGGPVGGPPPVMVLWLSPQHSGQPAQTLSTSSSYSSSGNSNTGSSSTSQSAFQVVTPDTPDQRTARVLAAHWAT